MAIHIVLGIPIAISRIQQHYFSNNVGFPIDKPELDAQSISYGEVTITNISNKEKVILDITLHITGQDGTKIKSRADLVGPFGMILGKDDKKAKDSANLPFQVNSHSLNNYSITQPTLNVASAFQKAHKVRSTLLPKYQIFFQNTKQLT